MWVVTFISNHWVSPLERYLLLAGIIEFIIRGFDKLPGSTAEFWLPFVQWIESLIAIFRILISLNLHSLLNDA